MEESGVLQSEQEISLIDILWRQDIDLGVEREAFDVHFQERELDAQRARVQEEERKKRESELEERVMLALRKMDKETGEILPQNVQGDDSTSFNPGFELMTEAFLSGQGSPITQNPLLSALLLSEKPPPDKEKASIELLALPDLQHYLDALEAHVPESQPELLEKIMDNSYGHQLHEPPEDNTVLETVSGPHVLAHIHSGCAEIMETPEYAVSHSGKTTQPLPQIIPEAPEIEQPFLDTEDFTESFLDTIMSTNPPENLNQRLFQLSSDLNTQEELFPELENIIEPEHSLCQHVSVQKDSSGSTCDMTLFSLESFSEPIDLDPSLYADDAFITVQPEAEEVRRSQSDQIELFDLSVLSDVVDLQPSETSSQHLTQVGTLLHTDSLSVHSEDLFETEATTSSLCEITTSSQSPQGHRSWSVCRDEERARTLLLPLSVDDIITMSVDAFNEAISTYELNEGQLSLMRDIRRRGKNKMAAQSCRKRKLDSLVDLEAEVEELREERERVMLEKESNAKALRETRGKLSKLYSEVFSQLRDEHGNPYSTKEYTLQYSTDGRFFILPRSPHASKHT
ncbi:nuclear factor erythroid 2-related factor 2b [Astyanax mexicanus]|uniref:nuclear factor erythroid 2-related factor 2b n=1 Tax=Astyanax mexicanus TaxID=7994 RepID=UPI0020CB37D7|nr:nuclear factor erythroid 2-related factor 2b [Astyanax mexicanus]